MTKTELTFVVTINNGVDKATNDPNTAKCALQQSGYHVCLRPHLPKIWGGEIADLACVSLGGAMVWLADKTADIHF